MFTNIWLRSYEVDTFEKLCQRMQRPGFFRGDRKDHEFNEKIRKLRPDWFKQNHKLDN